MLRSGAYKGGLWRIWWAFHWIGALTKHLDYEQI